MLFPMCIELGETALIIVFFFYFSPGEFIDLIECGNVDAALLVDFELNDVAW